VASNCAGITNCFTNLTGAIFNAGPNDLINVAAGNWPTYQQVNLYGKPLSIVGAGSGSTVINCGLYAWEVYYSPYYFQGVTLSQCAGTLCNKLLRDLNHFLVELYVGQASVSLQDVVLDSFNASSFLVEWGTMKFKNVTINGARAGEPKYRQSLTPKPPYCQLPLLLIQISISWMTPTLSIKLALQLLAMRCTSIQARWKWLETWTLVARPVPELLPD